MIHDIRIWSTSEGNGVRGLGLRSGPNPGFGVWKRDGGEGDWRTMPSEQKMTFRGMSAESMLLIRPWSTQTCQKLTGLYRTHPGCQLLDSLSIAVKVDGFLPCAQSVNF